jgi:hypothetical protein
MTDLMITMPKSIPRREPSRDTPEPESQRISFRPRRPFRRLRFASGREGSFSRTMAALEEEPQ